MSSVLPGNAEELDTTEVGDAQVRFAAGLLLSNGGGLGGEQRPRERTRDQRQKHRESDGQQIA